MKAFMSDRKARMEYQRAFGPDYLPLKYEAYEEWMKEALAEAKRILAETEPSTGSYFKFPEDQSILAEALTRFVAD